MMFHIMEFPHKAPVILPVISVRSDMETRSSITYEPSAKRCKKPFYRRWSEFREFAGQKKVPKRTFSTLFRFISRLNDLGSKFWDDQTISRVELPLSILTPQKKFSELRRTISNATLKKIHNGKNCFVFIIHWKFLAICQVFESSNFWPKTSKFLSKTSMFFLTNILISV